MLCHMRQPYTPCEIREFKVVKHSKTLLKGFSYGNLLYGKIAMNVIFFETQLLSYNVTVYTAHSIVQESDKVVMMSRSLILF